MFKKDSIWIGIILALVVMVGSWYALNFLNVWGSRYFFDKGPIFTEQTLQVFSIFMNVFPFRYFMLKTNKEWIGRGILLVTFVFGLAFFFYYLNKN